MKQNALKNTGLVILFSLGVIFYQVSLIVLAIVVVYIIAKKIIANKNINSDGWKQWK